MNLQSLKPAGTLAQRFGVKSIIYGPPGSGKTPLLNTAPRPVLLATEPGLLSMRGSTVPTFDAYTPERIKEFFDWLKGSNEVNNFDTVCIDSVSQYAEIELTKFLKTNKDGRKAYGELSREVMEQMNFLYFLPQKHIVLLAKEAKLEELQHSFNGPMPVTTTVYKKVPYFPGQDLNVKVPHLFDEILHVGKGIIPGVVGEQKYLRTCESSAALARDRSGRLAEYEPHDLNTLFQKCMS